MVVFCGMNSKSRSPFSSQKTVAVTLPADFSTLNILGVGEVLCFHCMDSKFGLRISVIYPSLVSCHQTLKKIFRILSEQLQVLLTALATSVLKSTQHSWDPSCTDLGHVQFFMNNGPNCSC